MNPNTPLLDFDDARARLLEAMQPVHNVETLALGDAHGRILATDATASTDVPAAANSAVDGYAVAAACTRADEPLRQIGTAHAGHPFDGRIQTGECVRIMTGGWLPAGADAVVMQEHAESDGENVTFVHTPNAGANIRPAGEDIAGGDIVIEAGSCLRAADIGLLATLGMSEIPVYRRPRIGYFSTGDELRPPGDTLGPGELYDSNRPMLAALLAELGVDARDLGHVPDDPGALERTLERGQTADAIVSTGGVSVGDADYVRRILAARGTVDFWRVAIKPGKPLAFGHLGDTRFFGLPGNPVSAAVTFMQLVRPALARLAGGRPATPQRHERFLVEAIERKPGRTEFMRAQQLVGDQGEARVRVLPHQGSGVLSSMRAADCFVVLNAESTGATAGSGVSVEPFAQRIWL